MKIKYWSVKHKIFKCIGCGTSERKHAQHKLCARCFSVDRYKNPVYRLKHKQAVYKWMSSHPLEWRVINNRALDKYFKVKRKKVALVKKSASASRALKKY